MRVFDKFEKPGGTLEDRLEYLQVFKSKDFKPVPFPNNSRQLEPYGWVTTESDIRRLIAWSQTELDYPYRKKEFQFKTWAPDEFYIRPFA